MTEQQARFEARTIFGSYADVVHRPEFPINRFLVIRYARVFHCAHCSDERGIWENLGAGESWEEAIDEARERVLRDNAEYCDEMQAVKSDEHADA